jgi:Ser/Thr protein kinase RdoA (MazF antagonist)
MQDEIVMLEDNTAEVLANWGLKPGDAETVGFVKGSLEGLARPIVGIGGARYVVRRQPRDLTEADTLFRHSFMRHLGARGLPVPELLPRPGGFSYAVVEDGIYELQGWSEGRRYITGDPDEAEMREAAASRLGALHQASAEFQWQPHRWPDDRSSLAVTQAYIALIRQRSEESELPPSVAQGLARVVEGCEARLDAAIDALEAAPRPPALHIHGDFQPHNLAFAPGVGQGLAAIYDFDAARYERRIDELAYALLYFAGARWDEDVTVTPPLVDEGLDVLAAHRFLAAYGTEAPPAEGEARLLADALTLAFPLVFANGIAEDLVFHDDFDGEPDEENALARLQWADAFWLWLDRYRDTLAQAWENL